MLKVKLSRNKSAYVKLDYDSPPAESTILEIRAVIILIPLIAR